MNNDQKLWDLLGRAPRPAAPPFFAAKVVRHLQTGAEGPSWLANTLRWLAPATVAALVVLAVLPRQAAEPVATGDLTTLDIVEMVSPDDYLLLTSAEVLDEDDALVSDL